MVPFPFGDVLKLFYAKVIDHGMVEPFPGEKV